MASDNFQAHDYYLMDELLTEEHRLIRDTTRAWVKKEVSPVVEDAAQKSEFPKQWIKGLAEVGAFGPYIPVGSSRVDLQACKLEYSIVSPK